MLQLLLAFVLEGMEMSVLLSEARFYHMETN